MDTKYRYILPIIVVICVFCESVFAVRVVSIPPGAPEYQRAIERFPDFDVITERLRSKTKGQDSAPTILRVLFNGIPEHAIFLSGRNVYPVGGICPESLFQEGTSEQDDAVQLLFEHNFPILDGEKFNHVMLVSNLVKEKDAIVKRVGELGKQIIILEARFKKLQRLEIKTRVEETRNVFERLDKTAIYYSEYCSVKQEAVEYLKAYVHEILPWEQLSSDYVGDRGDVIREGIQAINEHKSQAAEVRSFIKDDQFLAPLFGLYEKCQITEEGQVTDEGRKQLGFLKLFYRYWGKHAEDALIFKILQNLKEYERVPEVIEIYGNEDPCFQCQFKLQWLADNLADMINRAREKRGLPPITREPKEKLKIVYYAKKEFRGPCLINLSGLDVRAQGELTTRTELEIEHILMFEFTEGAQTQPLPPIVKGADRPQPYESEPQSLISAFYSNRK